MKKKINKLFSLNYLRNKWFDISTKNRIIYTNSAGAFIVKGFALLISFFTLPAYMRYFDNQYVLGLWFTLVSILIWILNFDLGIGNGLRNHLAQALTKKDSISAKQYISSAYFVFGGLVLFFTLIGYFLIPVVSWNKILNISAEIVSPAILILVVRYTFLGIMCYFFLRIISSVIYALQKSALNNFLDLSTNCLILAFVLLAPSRSIEENLIFLSISYGICLVLPLLVATIIIFSTTLKQCVPSLQNVCRGATKKILSLGIIFFVCQILYMLIVNTNEFFIAQYISPADVVNYQIYNRIFALGSMLFVLGLTPIWSIVTRAVAERDYIWILKLNKRLFKFACLFSIGEFLLILFLPFIIRLWLGSRAINVNYSYAFIFALWGISMIFQMVVSAITCGLGCMNLQALCYGIGILLKIVIIHFGMIFWPNWILVIVANIIILVPYVFIQNRANVSFLTGLSKKAGNKIC